MGEPSLIDTRVADEGDGFPLVLLHGWTGSKEDFLPILDALGRRRRLIVPDLPGQGETPPADDERGYSFQALVAWILDLLDTLGVGDFHLLGHSLGGLIAQRLAQAAAHRVLSLTLLATGPGAVGDEAREQVVRIATTAHDLGMEQALEEVLQGSTDPRKEFVRQRFMRMTPGAVVGGARNLVTAVPLGAFLRGVDFPVLVTHGMHDDIWLPHEQRLLARSITGARYEVIPDSQHSPAVENPAGLLALMEPFLAEADRRAANSKGKRLSLRGRALALARSRLRSLPTESRELALSLVGRGPGPQLLPGLPPAPVLVVAPHPDDEVIGPGATLARHADAGDEIRVLVVTSGGATAGGGGDVTGTREQETRRALERLGVPGEPVFGRLPDGGLPGVVDEVARLVAAHGQGIRSIYVPSMLDPHPDHRAAARAVALAGLAEDVEVYGYEVWAAAPVDVLVDVTDTFARKQAALAEYHTALKTVDYVRSASGLAAYRSAAGSLGGRGFAEGFLRLSMQDYRRLNGT